jgi:hypothetical protein
LVGHPLHKRDRRRVAGRSGPRPARSCRDTKRDRSLGAGTSAAPTCGETGWSRTWGIIDAAGGATLIAPSSAGAAVKCSSPRLSCSQTL